MKTFFAALLVLFSASGVIWAATPQPAVVPRACEWTLDTAFEHPQLIEVTFKDRSEPKRFWYMIITAVNKTKREVGFYPKCELMTDTFQILPSGKDVTPAVFELIKKRHVSRYPFLEQLEYVDNRILVGEDNARDIAIIWPDFDAKAKSMKLFISGLSNETAVIDHPAAKDTDGQPVKVFLRKTLELDYSVGGDPALRSAARLKYENRRWIMR